MSERDLAREFCKLTQSLFPVRIENALITPGLPDVAIIGLGSWVELKWSREWPKRGGPLRIPHYSQEQRNWAQKCIRRGGTCWLLLMCKGEWFIFHGKNPAYYLVGDLDQGQLKEMASAYFPKKPTSEELCNVFQLKDSK